MSPRILSVATAVPSHAYTQAQIRESCRDYFGPALFRNGHAGIFDRAGVQTRYLVEPKEYYFSNASFEAKNKNYFSHALKLATGCVRRCLKNSAVDFDQITHIFNVTTTGLLTPSLEAHLAQSLPFPRNVKRTPLFGVGCAGGVVGLARAGEYLRGHPDEAVLLVSVELCSLSFLPQDRSMIQLVAAAIFGDGAAAVVLCGDRFKTKVPGVKLLSSESRLLPDSLDVMGWDFSDQGMRLILSPRAPKVIETYLKPAVDDFLRKSKIRRQDVNYWLFHPGSSKIIDASAKALSLTRRDTRLSRRFLGNYGNLSSASVLFILNDALRSEKPPAGSHGMIAAMGPGFACELALVRFP